MPLTNFGLRLLKHVRAPAELPHYSGFLVEVSQKQHSRGSAVSFDADGGPGSVVKGSVY